MKVIRSINFLFLQENIGNYAANYRQRCSVSSVLPYTVANAFITWASQRESPMLKMPFVIFILQKVIWDHLLASKAESIQKCYSLADRTSRHQPDNVSSGKKRTKPQKQSILSTMCFLVYFTYTAMACGSYNSRGTMGHDLHRSKVHFNQFSCRTRPRSE